MQTIDAARPSLRVDFKRSPAGCVSPGAQDRSPLRATDCLVNHKKVMRLMQENGLSVRPRRRFVATTGSNHDGPLFPNLAKDVVPTGPNQLWVADITYIAIAVGFVYLAAILDAWS